MLSFFFSVGSIFNPVWYFRLSKRARQRKPVIVLLVRMNFNIVSYLSNGCPAQFELMTLNIRCSIKFHFEAPAGKCVMVISSPNSSARDWSPTFQSQLSLAFAPPESAWIIRWLLPLYFFCPISSHQERMEEMANALVSCDMPITIYPWF